MIKEDFFKKDITTVCEKIGQSFGYIRTHEETHSCKHNHTYVWNLHNPDNGTMSWLYIYYSYNKPVCACYVDASGLTFFYWWKIYNSSTTYKGLYEFLNARLITNEAGGSCLSRKFIKDLQSKGYSFNL